MYGFIADNIAVRTQTADADIPAHVSGGIAEDASGREVGAHVEAAIDVTAYGTSLYDFATTRRRQWEQLSRVP